VSINSEVSQVGAYFVLPHFVGMSFVVEEDKLLDVVTVSLFSSDTQIAQAGDCCAKVTTDDRGSRHTILC